jgi:hypothetical protein
MKTNGEWMFLPIILDDVMLKQKLCFTLYVIATGSYQSKSTEISPAYGLGVRTSLDTANVVMLQAHCGREGYGLWLEPCYIPTLPAVPISVDLAKSTTHSVENGQALKQGQYFRRCH